MERAKESEPPSAGPMGVEGSQPNLPWTRKERLRRIVRLLCPVCGRGRPFTGLMRQRESCEVCGYRFGREPGYFLGSIYFNYAATAGIEIGGYFALELLFELTFLQQLPIWLVFACVFPIWFQRYARSLWMATDLVISPPTEADFVVRPEFAEEER